MSKISYLNNKSILLISPEPWGDNFVSKHHIAIELAKRSNHVFFLNPPSGNQSIRVVLDNLNIVDYKPSYKGLSKIPVVLSAWIIKKKLIRLEQFCDTFFDIIWNFDSSSFFNLKSVKEKLRISHIVDYSENMNLKLLNSTADICFSTSHYILERQKIYNSNSFYIGHGNAIYPDHTHLDLTFINNSIKVGYVGNLLIKYLDWELIFNLVKTNPNISFFFAGPYTESNLSRESQVSKFLNHTFNKKNAFFLGSIKQAQIHSFLSQMDVLLLAYKTENNKEQLANPHKLLEYLACGKIIVSSWTEEYKDKRSLLEMVENNSQLPIKFKDVINNIEFYNSKEKQQVRIVWSGEHTYNKLVSRIEQLIENGK